MAENWDAVAAEVAQGLAEAGYQVTLVEPGVATGPEWDPQPGAPVETLVTAVEEKLSLTNRDATLVQTGDRMFMVAHTKKPELGWQMRIDGREYQIVAVESLRPGGVDLMYMVQVRA